MSVVHGTVAQDPASLRPKVMIYGVGYYGLETVRILVRKGWPIVAAVNRAGPKIGEDLDRLAGLSEDLGVIVQDCEMVDYATLDADIALVVQTERLSLNFAAYRRLLGAGINVICRSSESYFPQGADPHLAEKIDDLAKQNAVTFTGTGIWDFSRIWAGILIAGPCTELRSLTHRSLTDAELANERMMRAYGVDMTQAEFTEKVTKVPGQLGELYKGNTGARDACAWLHYQERDRATRAGAVRSTGLVSDPQQVLGARHFARSSDHRIGRNRRRADGKRTHRVTPPYGRRVREHDLGR